MSALARPQKITLAEMRDSGLRGLLIYCADYPCSHSVAARLAAFAPVRSRYLVKKIELMEEAPS
jgi:hypothetical protein